MNEQPYKWMTLTEENLILTVKAIPNSSKNCITDENEFLKIKITAPAVDNKANTAIVDYLSKRLKIAKSLISIKSGQTSKIKKILLPKNVDKEIINKIVD